MTLIPPLSSPRFRPPGAPVNRRAKPDSEHVLSAIPESLHDLLKLTQDFINHSQLDPTAQFSAALKKGLHAETISTNPFHYVFPSTASFGKRNIRTFRLPLTHDALASMEEIQKVYSLSQRQTALTALARCTLTPDGNVLVRAMRFAAQHGDPVPAPPALDGEHTEYIKLPKR